jgi:hypothetical protein
MTERRWIVRVHWLADRDDDDSVASRVLDHLCGHSAVVNQHPVDSVWEATISLEAATSEAAVAIASELVSAATGSRVAAEVLREHVEPPRQPG